MQTLIPTDFRDGKFILQGISWSTFKAIINDVGNNRAWRIAYDRGVLEIRMPLQEHEEPKGFLESLVEAAADELEIEVLKLGALTLEREDLNRAVEPDSCFYIQNEAQVRGKTIDLSQDPPPDLVIESDHTSSSLDKFQIYAALGVPELWRYRRQNLEVYQLVGTEYQLTNKSLVFDFLPVAEIPDLIAQSKTKGQRAVVRLFKQKVRAQLAQMKSEKTQS